MKRRLLAWLLLAALLMGLCACGKGSGQKLTLMIYMIGSDLESKSGAASDDLDEIRASGVDLDAVNVLVCAGGCEKWQSDAASADKNTVMKLTENGFETLEAWDAASMGDSKTLTQFLDYGVKSVPAESYALILWDHGNGPVMGYGKDTLHEKDALTLPEMRDALDASPFGKDNRLAWVGFDACLMASAELACVWDDFADYLVASQEVEPAFGWQYSFLKDAGKVETPKLLDSLTKTYLSACEDYYTEKGYSGRDTTLSCMDLSKAAAVEDAIDALFAKAAADVDMQYNRLASRRVNTRALGRATTGSEYDLVDLNDMAGQLAAYYPDEAKALQDAVGAMVVSNATNAEGLAGVSLYYPFFNKYYYEDDWAEAYEALDLFPAYHDYLKGYGETWLGERQTPADAMDVPTLTAPGEYTLQLTDEQAERYAGARFHILLQESEDVYIPIFTSPQVTFDEKDKTLTAQFDGRVLYVVNDHDAYTIPVTRELGSDNGLMHYAVDCTLMNDDPASAVGEHAESEGYEFAFTHGWFHLAIDPETGEVQLCSLLEQDEDADDETLMQGKAEELALDGWNLYSFLYDAPHILTRDAQGAVLPLNEWNTTDIFSSVDFPIADGLRFAYAPLEAGSYSLVFELIDTQGARRCSEVTAIDSDSVQFRETQTKTPTEVDWQSGDRITLLERDGLTLRLVNKEDEFGYPIQTFELTNDTDETVLLTAYDAPIIANGDVCLADGYLSDLRADPGETSTTHFSIFTEGRTELGFYLGDAVSLGAVTQVDTLQFAVSIRTLETHETIWDREPFLVHYSPDTAPASDWYLSYDPEDFPRAEDYRYPYLGARADEQTLYSDNELEVRLLYLGGNSDGDRNECAMRFTNRSDQTIYLGGQSTALNGVAFGTIWGDYFDLPPHTSVYKICSFVPNDFDDAWNRSGVTGIQSVRLLYFRSNTRHLRNMGFGEPLWLTVQLAEQADEPGVFPTDGTVLYDQDGLRVTLLGFTDGDPYCEWTLAVENNSNQDLSLGITEVSVNGGEAHNQYRDQTARFDSDSFIGTHQRRIVTLLGRSGTQTLSFRFAVKTLTGDRILYTTQDVITLEKQ